MKIGDKVTYIPFKGAAESLYEKGIIKSIQENGVFVVFHCNEDWDNYQDYTGQLCGKHSILCEGWH